MHLMKLKGGVKEAYSTFLRKEQQRRKVMSNHTKSIAIASDYLGDILRYKYEKRTEGADTNVFPGIVDIIEDTGSNELPAWNRI